MAGLEAIGGFLGELASAVPLSPKARQQLHKAVEDWLAGRPAHEDVASAVTTLHHLVMAAVGTARLDPTVVRPVIEGFAAKLAEPWTAALLISRVNQALCDLPAPVADELGEILAGDFVVRVGGELVYVHGATSPLQVSEEKLAGPAPLVDVSSEVLHRLAMGASLGELLSHPDVYISDPELGGRLERAWSLFLAARGSQSRSGTDGRAGTKVVPSATRPKVVVLGGGITGLTVAHELAERGFQVEVVERMRHPDREDEAWVGGVAATQWACLPGEEAPADRQPIAALAPPNFVLGGDLSSAPPQTAPFQTLTLDEPSTEDPKTEAMRPTTRPRSLHRVVGFDAASDQPVAKDLAAARAAAKAMAEATGAKSLVVEVCALDRGGPEDRELAWRRIQAVAAELEEIKGDAGEHLVGRTWEQAEAGRPLMLRPYVEKRASVAMIPVDARGRHPEDRVWFVVEEVRVPGEHGYRFFPRYYRNLFHTMRRIPVYDARGEETAETCFDNLVPARCLNLVTGKGRVVRLGRGKPRSLHELRSTLGSFRVTLGFSNRDLALFEVRIFRYLTSCRRRRIAEAEPKSWREYMGEKDFSPAFQRFLQKAPKALAAMDTDEIDARTHGNTSAQLLLDHVGSETETDFTLNGPTSTAFLQPWKRYLGRLGVTFRVAEVEELVWIGSEIVPKVKDMGHPPQGTGCKGVPWDVKNLPDYWVLAVPLEVAWSLTRDIAPPTPDPDQLVDGDLLRLVRWRQAAELLASNAIGEKYEYRFGYDLPRVGPKPVGPFRDTSGVQYYFPYGYELVDDGHAFFLDAPWGLSSINQPPYWRVRRTLVQHRYVSALSVDLGDMYVPSPARVVAGKVVPSVPAAIQASRQQLAEETWRQIEESLPPHQRARLAAPSWYHVDGYLHYGDDKLVANRAPYLVNLPGDWALRPGTETYPASPTDHPGDEVRDAPLHCFGGGIEYAVSNGRWVLAGPHMKTHTRLTSMEAANESGRHAANAILHHVATRSEGRPWSGVLLGSYCRIWDPEEHELDDLRPLKELDERLFAKGLPNLVDILKLERVADLVDPMSDLGDLDVALQQVEEEAQDLVGEVHNETVSRVFRWWRGRKRKALDDLGLADLFKRPG